MAITAAEEGAPVVEEAAPGVAAAAEGTVAAEGASDAAIVIGDNMEGRVIPYARDIGADFYKPAPGAQPSRGTEPRVPG